MTTTTAVLEGIRQIDRDDVASLAGVLARAFHEDPVGAWLFPDATGRQRGLTRLFESEIQHVTLPHGECLTSRDGTGAALWLPPGHWKVPPLTLTRLLPRFMGIFGRRLTLILRGLFEVEKHHPSSDDHFYLPFIGVQPDHQGFGIGSSLLKPVLERCDQSRVGAYLEATCAANRRLYERHGFTVVREIQLPDGPPVWPMWRSPSQYPLAAGDGAN